MQTYNFVLFQCVEEEFGCADGTCIPISKRCDGASDCSDNFDETNCKIVVVNKQLYNKEFPSMNKDGSKTEIRINVTILSIEGFNEIDMTFKIRFELAIQW